MSDNTKRQIVLTLFVQQIRKIDVLLAHDAGLRALRDDVRPAIHPSPGCDAGGYKEGLNSRYGMQDKAPEVWRFSPGEVRLNPVFYALNAVFYALNAVFLRVSNGRYASPIQHRQ
jgi:hypothetical protein